MTKRWLIAALLLAAATLPGSAQAATTSGFVIAPSANLGSETSTAVFDGVTAPSTSNAWIVGQAGGQALTEHWNGSSWAVQTLPVPAGAQASELYAVSSTTPNDVWAVGDYQTITGPDNPRLPLVLVHTASGWHNFGIGLPGVTLSSVYGVAVASPTNITVLAVDSDDCADDEIHYDGSSWTLLDEEDECDAGSGTELGNVAVTGLGAIWETGDWYGDYGDDSGALADCSGLACPPTAAPTTGDWDADVAGTTANTWVIGERSVKKPLMLHWNGTRWQNKSPNFGYTSQHEVGSAVVLPDKDVWAVGSRASTGERTLILEYTDGSWQDLGGPNVAGVDNWLSQVAHVTGTPTQMWAVGMAGSEPLLLHHP